MMTLCVVAGLVMAAAPALAQQEGVPLSVQPYGSGGGSGGAAATTTGGGGGAAGGSGAVGSRADLINAVYKYDASDPDELFYGLDLPNHQLYRGIIPGVRETLPHIRPQQVAGLKSTRTSRLTWIGYQRMPDKSRVFLQTYNVPAFRVERGKLDGEVMIVLQDTSIGTYNFRRLMDTRFFPRSIAGVRSYRQGRDTYVSILLRDKVEFSVSVQGNYLFVDFEDAALEKKYGGWGAESGADLNKDNELREID
jgi:hypothetical protein